jgi:hypothetical protein
MNYYSQVLLVNVDNRMMVTWIPSGYAEIGRMLKLRDDRKGWTYGWKVVDVYGIKSSEKLELLNLVLKDFKVVLGK